jgi:hypothetical protein
MLPEIFLVIGRIGIRPEKKIIKDITMHSKRGSSGRNGRQAIAFYIL